MQASRHCRPSLSGNQHNCAVESGDGASETARLVQSPPLTDTANGDIMAPRERFATWPSWASTSRAPTTCCANYKLAARTFLLLVRFPSGSHAQRSMFAIPILLFSSHNHSYGRLRFIFPRPPEYTFPRICAHCITVIKPMMSRAAFEYLVRDFKKVVNKIRTLIVLCH